MGGIEKLVTAAVADSDARLDHDEIDHFGISLQLEVTLLRDRHKSLKKGIAGHPVVSELQIAIVEAIMTEFCADIANFDSWERLVSFPVANRNDEGLYAIVALECDASCKNDSMRR